MHSRARSVSGMLVMAVRWDFADLQNQLDGIIRNIAIYLTVATVLGPFSTLEPFSVASSTSSALSSAGMAKCGPVGHVRPPACFLRAATIDIIPYGIISMLQLCVAYIAVAHYKITLIKNDLQGLSCWPSLLLSLLFRNVTQSCQ